jgi:AraC family transcriptional activator of pobA
MKQEVIPIVKLEDDTPLKFTLKRWKKIAKRTEGVLPHRHNYYQIIIVFKGGGQHEIDFKAYKMQSCSLHFIAPDLVHTVNRLPASDGCSMSFSDDYLLAAGALAFNIKDLPFFKNGNYPILNLTAAEFKAFNVLIQEMEEEMASSGKSKDMVLRPLLQIFLAKAQRIYDRQSEGGVINLPKNKFVSEFETLVEINFTKHLRAGDYARQLNVSPNHLNDLCKQYFSKTTEQVIHNRLMLEIKRLLVYSDKTVKEICYELNFEDPAYFNRFFKKHTGTTPMDYRKSAGKH